MTAHTTYLQTQAQNSLCCCAVLTGVRGSDFVCFYDWNEGRLVRRIDVGAVKDVIWSDNGELVAIAGDASFYILQVSVCTATFAYCWYSVGGVLMGNMPDRPAPGALVRLCAHCCRFTLADCLFVLVCVCFCS